MNDSPYINYSENLTERMKRQTIRLKIIGCANRVQLIIITEDGNHGFNVFKNPPNLPERGFIESIKQTHTLLINLQSKHTLRDKLWAYA